MVLGHDVPLAGEEQDIVRIHNDDDILCWQRLEPPAEQWMSYAFLLQ